MLLIGCQKEHPACKNWVMRCWCGYFSGARCRLFAYGPADATAIPRPNHLLLHLNPVLLFWYWLTQVVPENGSLNACNIGMSILCEYAIATYFSHCRIFCIFQQTAHIAYFFHVDWHFLMTILTFFMCLFEAIMFDRHQYWEEWWENFRLTASKS